MSQPPFPRLNCSGISPAPDKLDRLLEAARKRKRARTARLVVGLSIVAVGLGAGLGLPRLAGTTSQPAPTSRPTPTATSTVASSPPPSGLPTVQGSTVKVPYVECSTIFGLASAQPVRPPATVRAKLPSDLVGRVAAYGDGFGYVTVLGPAGWTCTALDAADGAVNVLVTPLSQPTGSMNWPAPFKTDDREAIAAYFTSSCAGCRYDLLCPLLPNMLTASNMAGFGPCAVPPTPERLLYRSSSVALFFDPPFVAGDGAPSGGMFSAEGVVIHHPPVPRPGDEAGYEETCTVGSSYGDLCNATLYDFIHRWG